jgi:hypothetical protein
MATVRFTIGYAAIIEIPKLTQNNEKNNLKAAMCDYK